MALAYWHALSTTNSEISNVVYYKKAGGELNLDHAKYIAISIGLLIPSFFIPVLVLWPVKRAFHGIIRAYFSKGTAKAGLGVHSAAWGLSLLWFALLLTLFRAALPPL